MAIPNFVKLEKDILKRWKDEDVFKKTLEKEVPKGRFVFFEGPPTANGLPHIGHVETRAFKDIIPRFKTMQGFRVERKAGWDTQGLPVELEVEKAIGVSGKQDIEKYGIAKFNEQCRKSVWKYKELWEQMTERVGFWLDLKHPYITYENSYIETLWWILKQAWDAKLFVQDYKVVHYCPRCGTALSSHEVAQGYERVKDRSVYVKFQLEQGQKIADYITDEKTFILAWTTTPWTLPGNVALAVHPELVYVKVNSYDSNTGKNEKWILEENQWKQLSIKWGIVNQKGVAFSQRTPEGGEFAREVGKIEWKKRGKELASKSLRYKPLFDFLDLRKDNAPSRHSEQSEESPKGFSRTHKETLRSAQGDSSGRHQNAYTVVPADFVTTEEGTGVVHTAVMYGEDDFQLGTKLDLPKKHTVTLEGKFNELVKPWAGKEVKAKETEDAIVEYLRKHGKLYKEEMYEHDYPFCWRCKHPLLYYAKTSWFITMSKLRRELLANNERIQWVPEHIKEGRFGEWLREVKDWAISRERYWGTPLPIWVCDQCGHRQCLGSYAELLERVPTRNRFIFVRHGEAANDEGAYHLNGSIEAEGTYSLTKKGRAQVEKTAKRLVKEKPDLLFVSPFRRTKETAEIIAQATGLKPEIDDRLREIAFGPEFEGKTDVEYHAQFADTADRFHRAPPGGETFLEARQRMFSFLHEVDAKYEGKTIVVVSHGDPLFVIFWALSLHSETQVDDVAYPEEYAGWREVVFSSVLFRPDGSFDPHRPFIDAVAWTCQHCGKGTMKRIPEVADTWFDSGSMPFAQWHYPFENEEKFKESYPAAFISEAIDQTRGWFYTLLAISTFLQKAKAVPAGPPYETCVVLGHIRDKQGRKLSKSLGNYIDPMKLLDKYGADAVRMYLFTINQPSEPKNFDEDQLGEVKKNFMILWNVLSFWKLHSPQTSKSYQLKANSSNVMDCWILALLNQTTASVTKKLEQYAIVDAGRELMSFVTELSTWYVRRSRERAKGDGKDDVAATLGFVLRQYAKLSAPFTPFLSDTLWRELGGKTSVHLEDWPQAVEPHVELLQNMAAARKVVEVGHALRAQAKLKVRQPLSQLVVMQEFRETTIEILQDELNVKEVVVSKKLPQGKDWVAGEGVALDVTVTDELREEGYFREMTRAINSLRKELKLKPGEPVALVYQTDEESVKVVEHFKTRLMKKGSLASLERAASVGQPSSEAELDGKRVRFGSA